MAVRVVKLPDVGEGIAEAELVAWHVAVGDQVTPETVLAEVMTDKATVEISAPVAGTITFITGTAGDVLSVGADLVGIDADGSAAGTQPPTPPSAERTPTPTPPPDPAPLPPRREPQPAAERPAPPPSTAVTAAPARPIAAPAVRQRARDLGVDLRLVRGSGPAGRITHADVDAHLAGADGDRARVHGVRRASRPPADLTHEIPIVGLRRKIAERTSLAATRIPHITYVDEVDVTAVEEVRAQLNREFAGDDDDAGSGRLTLLPFLCRAIVVAAAEQPHLNATFDDERGVLTTSDGVHIGVATQTPNGLVVPVVRDAQTLDLWACAHEIARLSEAARSGSASRAELAGSTITITSLGALGGLVTTPIINHPEVAIVGVNKMQVRPVWDGTTFAPRRMMNLSSSFDHRIVDGWDAATFVQRIKALLESPAVLLVDRSPDPSRSR